MHFRWTQEDEPGPRWLELFGRAWPAYSDWFLGEGPDALPDLPTCREKLRAHMPELVPVWERLVEVAGGDELVARMLSLYRPPAYVAGCSQAVWTRAAPMLVRNYDYHPARCEATFAMTTWAGTRVLASSDCLWGALDGMNQHGLVVALAFGGSKRVGDGFGIPLILRYVLQQCATVAEAAVVLRRVPSHMAYNVSLLDVTGEHAVARVAPGRKTTVDASAIATNHQRASEWPEYVTATRSVERAARLRELLRDDGVTAQAFTRGFLEPPLHVTRYERGRGTLYTAAYHPRELGAEFLWPHGRCDQSFADFRERELAVPLVG